MIIYTNFLIPHGFAAITGTVRVTWRDHIYRDGVEIDSARVARSKTYSVPEGKTEFDADLGADAAKYAALF